MFNVFNNFDATINFAFFISVIWTIIGTQKTQEFVMFQFVPLSIFKIIITICYFVLIFSVFYLFVYKGPILKKLSEKSLNNQHLERFDLYQNINHPCEYNILLFKDITFAKNALKFKSLEMLKFKNCIFTKNIHVKDGSINNGIDNKVNIDGRFIEDNKMLVRHEILDYNFDILHQNLAQKLDRQTYKTFFENLLMLERFKKLHLNTREIEVGVIDNLRIVVSFFYMTIMPFIFFSTISNRNGLLLKILISIIFGGLAYITDTMLALYVKQSTLLSPVFIIIPPIVILLITFIALVFSDIRRQPLRLFANKSL